MAAPKTEAPKHLNGETPPSEPEVVEPQETAQPMRVFGLSGAEVWLANRGFHYARFTTQYVRRFIAYLDESVEHLPPIAPIPGATLGEMVAEAVLSGDEKVQAQFERWLGHVLVEAVPPGIAEDCLPEELVAVVENFFHLSGFNLYGRTIKNLFAPESDVLDASIRQFLQNRREAKDQEAVTPTSDAAASEPPQSAPITEESPSTS